MATTQNPSRQHATSRRDHEPGKDLRVWAFRGGRAVERCLAMMRVDRPVLMLVWLFRYDICSGWSIISTSSTTSVNFKVTKHVVRHKIIRKTGFHFRKSQSCSELI